MKQSRVWMACVGVVLGAGVCEAADLGAAEAMQRVGLSAEVFAASGITGVEVESVLDRLTDARSSLVQLEQLSESQDSLSAALRGARATARNPRNDSEFQTAVGLVDSIRTQLIANESATAQLREQILRLAIGAEGNGDHAVEMAMPEELEALLPCEYRVVTWSRDEVLELASSLMRERSVLSAGGSLSGADTHVLSSARSRPDVALARAAKQANIAAVEAAVVSYGE